MEKIIKIIVMALVLGIGNLQAQTYDSLWKQLEKCKRDDLPKSVRDVAQTIADKAQKERNFAHYVKARAVIAEADLDLNPDAFSTDSIEKELFGGEKITALLKGKSARQRKVAEAVLHLVAANIYNVVSESHVHDYDATDFSVPICAHLDAAFADMTLLAQTDNKAYVPLVERHRDGDLYDHDMLSVMLENAQNCRHGMHGPDHWASFYERAAQTYTDLKRPEAATLTSLMAITLRGEATLVAEYLPSDEYLAALRRLYDQSAGLKTQADVAIGLAAQMHDEDESLLFLRRAISEVVPSPRVGDLRYRERSIMDAKLSFSMKSSAGRTTYSITYHGTDSATLTVRAFNGRTKKNNVLSTDGTVILQQKMAFGTDDENTLRKAKGLPIRGEYKGSLELPAGHYVVELTSAGLTKLDDVDVTSLCVFVLANADSTANRVRVLDSKTGRPVAGASLLCYCRSYQEDKPDAVYVTDENGEIAIPYGKYATAVAYRDISKRGSYLADHSSRIYLDQRSTYESYDELNNLRIYTDRSIYRPGQKVHVGILAYSVEGDESHVLQGSSLTVYLQNPDGEEIATTDVTTNAMGSATADFDLPEQCRLGAYSVNVSGDRFCTSADIRVEEYKRPTFEVLIDEACEQNDEAGFSTLGALGDTLLISGQALAYSGAPVQEGEVTMQVEWSEDRWFFMSDWEQFCDDITATTDGEGRFRLQLPAVPEDVIHGRAVRLRLTVTVADPAGEQQSVTLMLRVRNDKFVVDEQDEEEKEFITVTSDTFTPQSMPEFRFKAQEDDALVYYYLVGAKGIISEGSRVLTLGDSLTYQPEYADENGKTLAFVVYYVRNGHKFSASKSIELAQPDKELKLSWSTFRDRLQPGQKEKWTLSVTDSKGRSVRGAEVMAVMYDASLDALYPHGWEFDLQFRRDPLRANASASSIDENCYMWMQQREEIDRGNYWQFDLMPLLLQGRRYVTEVMYSVKPMMLNRKETGAIVMEEDADLMDDMAVVTADEEHSASAGASQLRTNLSELAFFMPQILTDRKGRAQLSFTLPDCLTEWKVMCLAHTADMHHGTLTAKATASRDFMVQPNMPRFLRQGDKAVIAAKVQNLCDHGVEGTATLRLLSAADEKVVATVSENFSVEMGKTSSVSFALDASMPAGDYICEIVATDGKVQDGERNRLPVLTTRRRVVENVPFFGDYDESKIDKAKLYNGDSPTATDRVYEVQQVPDAEHLVFQSLRALEVPEHDNAPALAAALYTNVVLADMSKRIADGIDGFSVVEAQQKADMALQKLGEMQLRSGAFPWFKGMDASGYMTLAVAEHLSHLADYTAQHSLALDGRIDRMLRRAVAYLDKEEKKRYDEYRQKDWPLYLSESTLRYLHLTDNADSALLKDYLDLYEKEFRNTTMYGRAKGVLLLQKYGRTAAAQRFLASLKEHTVYREGFGRYFATDQAYYSWMDYRVPTQVAAMKAMSLLPTSPQGGGEDGCSGDENQKMLCEMLLWLLRQKQTQVWENPLNAIDVAQLLLENDRMPRVSWGFVHTEYTEDESKLGSYTTGELTIQRSVIRQENGHITVRHTIHADRDMDFVSVSSDRSADLEPLRQLSGYQRVGTRWGYVELHDSYTTFFFDHFTTGTTTIDLDYYVARPGTYSAGISEVRCEYAPEFGARSK